MVDHVDLGNERRVGGKRICLLHRLLLSPPLLRGGGRVDLCGDDREREEGGGGWKSEGHTRIQ